MRGRLYPCLAALWDLGLASHPSPRLCLGSSLWKHLFPWRIWVPRNVPRMLLGAVQPLQQFWGSSCLRGTQQLSSRRSLMSLRSQLNSQEGMGSRMPGGPAPPLPRPLGMVILLRSKEMDLLKALRCSSSRTLPVKVQRRNPGCAAGVGWVPHTRSIGLPWQKNAPWPAGGRK